MSREHGFSLIELLVVMVILAVLAAVLLPAVRLVRDAATTAACAGNLRQIGAYIIAYADENHGRLPGSGHSGAGSVSWCDILNRELLGPESGVKLPRMTDPPGSNLLCPAYDAPPGSWRRCYTYNAYAAGGGSGWGPPPTSDYGLVFSPPSRRDPAYAGWAFYCQGAPLMRFSDPAGKVLLQENERVSDHCNASWPEGRLTQGDDPGYPAFCANGGIFAFRHRGGTVANFLYIDLHVEGLHPSGSLNRASRYAFGP